MVCPQTILTFPYLRMLSFLQASINRGGVTIFARTGYCPQVGPAGPHGHQRRSGFVTFIDLATDQNRNLHRLEEPWPR